MEKSPSSPMRQGTPGLDVFKIAGASISGYVPSHKTGDRKYIRQPYTSILEQRLSLYLDYHPHVRFYQRGDVSPAFVSAHHLNTPLGAPYRIAYTYEGKPHEYLPDYVGTFSDGGLLIAEAGRASEKSKGQALAKAEAARRLAQLKGGEYWIGTDENLPESRHLNWLYLHVRRKWFTTYDDIAATLLKDWPWGDLRTVNEFIQRFGSRWSETEVEAAVWKLAGDAAAEGRLLVDLTEVELSRSTPLALLEPGAPPILPDSLPSSLEQAEHESSDPSSAHTERGADVLEYQGVIPGPTFDATSFSKAWFKTSMNQCDN